MFSTKSTVIRSSHSFSARTAMSFWAWGLAPQLAAVLSIFGALTGQVIAAVTVRRGFDIRALLPFVLGGLVGVPLGVWLLPRLDIVRKPDTLFDYRFEDFEIADYRCHAAIKAPVAV